MKEWSHCCNNALRAMQQCSSALLHTSSCAYMVMAHPIAQGILLDFRSQLGSLIRSIHSCIISNRDLPSAPYKETYVGPDPSGAAHKNHVYTRRGCLEQAVRSVHPLGRFDHRRICQSRIRVRVLFGTSEMMKRELAFLESLSCFAPGILFTSDADYRSLSSSAGRDQPWPYVSGNKAQ